MSNRCICGLVLALAAAGCSSSSTGPGSADTVEVTPATRTLVALGDTVRLTATAEDVVGNPVEGRFSWSSSDPLVAEVDTGGLVTAVANGVVVIEATLDDATGQATITVSQVATVVEVSPSVHTFLALSDTLRLQATATDGNGYVIPSPRFAWSSSAPSVTGVDTTGLVTALSKGFSVVSAMLDGVTDQTSVTVSQVVFSVTIDPPSHTFEFVGEDTVLVATAWDANDYRIEGAQFAWRSLNPNIADLIVLASTDSAYVYAQGQGNTPIEAASDGVEGYANIDVLNDFPAVSRSRPLPPPPK